MSVILTLRHPDRRSLLSYDLDDAVLGTHPGGGDPTLCFEEALYKILSAASGVAYKQTRHLSRS
jgi:hypothetical protein